MSNQATPFDYYYDNKKNPYTQSKRLPVAAPRKTNSLWTNYGFAGIIAGAALILFGVALIPVEVSRIIAGSLNRGVSGSYYLYPNYNKVKNAGDKIVASFKDTASLADKGIVPYDATLTGSSISNYPIQDKYLWPWSHAALLFSLVTIAAGILGVLSGCRKTYSSIFAFFTLSLLSGFLGIFLVVYYSVHVYWQVNKNSTNRGASLYSNLDYGLGAAMLAISGAVTVLSFIASLVACCAAGICRGAKSPLLKMNTKPPKSKKTKVKEPAYIPEQPFRPPAPPQYYY